ncbi:MAG: hypothetical protein M9887_04580 [Chitinophagales bacterium]|nr:hypothetical protein [Chitinophagales bacterium]
MKKGFLQIAFGALALTVGLTSCKKDKDCDIKCVDFVDDYGSYTTCSDEFPSMKAFDAYVSSLKAYGYKINKTYCK